MNIIPKKLREAGCTSTASPTPYNGEIIYKQADAYYPTFANGYKAAARCSSMAEACKWIDDNRFAHGGARKGAGRPKRDSKPIGLRLSSEALAVLERMAADSDRTKSQVVEAMLLAGGGKEARHGQA